MKKYLPIRIFSIKYAYGWWWGKYFFFFGKHSTAFAIIPMCNHLHQCEYMNGKAIEDGDTLSWSPERQREKQEQFADEYMTAIATEIVSRTSDEELAAME